MVERLPVPGWDRTSPRHSIVTVVVRAGLAVIGPAEARWLVGWHYCNHLRSVYTADLIVVTEHGWVDFMSGLGGDVSD